MMELCHITAGYGGLPVLRDVSLAFEPGKVTVLAVPNGCGKSTLLRVAARLMAPERGEVRIEGQDVSRLSAKQFARLAALLPQSRPLPGITAGSLVLHGRFPYLGYPRRYSREDREAARQAMERTGVAGLEGVPMAHLSGGQRQKVYLAMALAQDTPVLLLDEPTTFLDIAHQLELAETARTLAGEGKAVVMVLHDLNLALSCAHRVAVLEEGQLRRVGAPEEIYASGVLEKVFQVRAHSVETAKGERQYLFSRL